METIPKSLVRRIGHLPDSRYQSIAQGRTPPESGEEPRKEPRRWPGPPVLPDGLAQNVMLQLSIFPVSPLAYTVTRSRHVPVRLSTDRLPGCVCRCESRPGGNEG